MKTVNTTIRWDDNDIDDFRVPQHLLIHMSKAFENNDVFIFECNERLYHLNFANARWLCWEIQNETSP